MEQLPELEEIETTDLMSMVVEQVELVKKTKANLAVFTQSAREIQIELGRRGFKMEFDELSTPLSGGEIRLTPEIPSPGLTEGLPEELPREEIVSDPGPADTRSVAQIQRDSAPTAAEVAREAASFEADAASSYQNAFEKGMRDAAKRMREYR